MCALFEGKQTLLPVTPTVTTVQSGELGIPPIGATSAGMTSHPVTVYERRGVVKDTASTSVGASSSDYTGQLFFMENQVANVIRDPPRLAKRDTQNARLGSIKDRPGGRGDRQTPVGTADYVLNAKVGPGAHVKARGNRS